MRTSTRPWPDAATHGDAAIALSRAGWPRRPDLSVGAPSPRRRAARRELACRHAARSAQQVLGAQRKALRPSRGAPAGLLPWQRFVPRAVRACCVAQTPGNSTGLAGDEGNGAWMPGCRAIGAGTRAEGRHPGAPGATACGHRRHRSLAGGWDALGAAVGATAAFALAVVARKRADWLLSSASCAWRERTRPRKLTK